MVSRDPRPDPPGVGKSEGIPGWWLLLRDGCPPPGSEPGDVGRLELAECGLTHSGGYVTWMGRSRECARLLWSAVVQGHESPG
ncbi:hypothetical protein Emed_007600 [Eimeria media]